GHVVVGAALEPRDGVRDGRARGEDDDGDRVAGLAQAAQHGEAVLVGEPEVEHEEGEVAGAREVERLAPGRHRRARVARGAQTLGHERRDAGLVLRDEDLAHRVVLPSGAGREESSGRGPGPSPGSAGVGADGALGTVGAVGATGPGGAAAAGPGPSSAGTGTSGRSSANVDPTPGVDATRTRPPWPAALAATSPRPAPSGWARPGVVAWAKRSKMRGCSSGAIPTPSSRTHTRTRAPSSDTAEPSATTDPGAENFTALAASCRSAWVRRCASTRA